MYHSIIKACCLFVIILFGNYVDASGINTINSDSNNYTVKYTDQDSINKPSINKGDSILLENIARTTNDTTDLSDSTYTGRGDTLQQALKTDTISTMDTGMTEQDTSTHYSAMQDTHDLSLKDTTEQIIDSASLQVQEHLTTMDTGSIHQHDSNIGPSQPTITVEPTDLEEDEAIPGPSDEQTQTMEDTYESPAINDPSGNIYKIQIAASKKPLGQHALDKIYTGEKQISQETENGWYKYAIGDFNSYKNAVKYCRKLQNENFFVKGYKNGVKFYPYPEGQTKINSKLAIKRNQTISQDSVMYGIQIASATKPISNIVLKLLYHGEYTVYETRVNDYYAYITNLTPSLTGAKEALKRIDIPSAFIVKYENGERTLTGQIQ